MKKRDIIISALACGGKMSCRKEAAKFKDPPLVININSGNGVSTWGGTIKGFRNATFNYKLNDSVIEGLIKSHKVNPRRICIVSYLGGWGFTHEVLKTKDRDRIDTIIALEGINTRSIDPWIAYALNGGRLWNVSTHASHKTASSKSNLKNILLKLEHDPEYKNIDIPKYLSKIKLEKSASIYSKYENPRTKMFHEDTLEKCFTAENYVGLLYKGKQTQDQIYIQQYVQPRLWRWLRELWKKPTNGRVF